MLYELIAIVRPGSLKEVKEYVNHRQFICATMPTQSTTIYLSIYLLRLISRFVYRIAKNAGVQVLRSGGVVRGYTNWGTFTLPKPTTKHQARYSEGYHFIMRFDASGPVQSAVRRTLSLDPRMIRFSVIKIGDKLEEINDVPGRVDWNGTKTLITDSIVSRALPRSSSNDAAVRSTPYTS
ncbi:37S ribosomal protein MRP17 [Talaromyces pinophilus]|nr:37S ribosomal protein MRP17 [Talaromyces pinophilus]